MFNRLPFLNRPAAQYRRLSKYQLSQADIDQFASLARQVPEGELYQANPQYLANQLGWPLPKMLDFLTLGVAETLWHLNWQVYCPACDSTIQDDELLGRIHHHQQCPACGWAGDIRLDEEVAVTATPDEKIRRLKSLRNKPDKSQRLSALALINRPLFRETLGEQILPDHHSLGVQRLAVFFSDLVASTALYQRLGDGQAYRLVSDHFQVIFQAVEKHGGSAVKTIGDGIMGAFPDNANALRGVLESMRALEELNLTAGLSGEDRLRIKTGLHSGPCIVVTLNHRLDYFGTTVNIAARLAAVAGPGELLISQSILSDPELKALAGGLGRQDEINLKLRGVSTPFPARRIRFG